LKNQRKVETLNIKVNVSTLFSLRSRSSDLKMIAQLAININEKWLDDRSR